MTFPTLRLQPADLLLPALAALPVAVLITVVDPALALPVIFGSLALILAFLSPAAGIYVLVFSMLLGPELLIGGLGSGATLGRGVTLRFDDVLLVLVGLGWLGRMALSQGMGRLARTPLNRPIIYYTAACGFATLMGILAGRVTPSGGFFFFLKYYEYFFLYFMTVNLVSSRREIRHLVWASLLTCLLVTLYALWQVPSGGRVSAPFEGARGEPNTLGGYLVFILAVVTGLLLTSGAVSNKLPYAGVLGLGAIALQATLSRASFLAGGVVFLGVLELVRRRSPLLLAMLLLGVLVSPMLMPESVIDRIAYTFSQPEEEGQLRLGELRVDTSTSERLRSWEQALEHFWRSPVWGLGVTGGPFMDAMYPRVLMETGLIGAVSFVYLLYSLFRMGLNAYRRQADPYLKGLALGFLMGFAGLLIHAIGANTFIIVRIMEPFWLYAALVARSLILADEGPAGAPVAPAPDASRVPRLVPLGLLGPSSRRMGS